MKFVAAKSLLYLTLGLTIGFGLGLGIGQSSGSGGDAARDPNVIDVEIAGRPYMGPDDAPVTIVEFTDYECGFCKRHFDTRYPALMEQYGDQVKYVVRSFPLSHLHRSAERAAQAAECAHEQGAFWEYHTLLFRNFLQLADETLKQHALRIGLDMRHFERCLNSGEKADVIYNDMKDAVTYGVVGTPTFFVNGRMLVGAQPLTVFKIFIEGALEEQGLSTSMSR